MIRLRYILVWSATLSVLFSCNSKDECEETWSVSGRIRNGTTLKPFPTKVGFRIELFDVKPNGKATNVTNIGEVFTDDSGFFKLEYPCKEKVFDKMTIKTLAPYSGYVWENVFFDKHFYKEFYHSTHGTGIILLEPKSPLQAGDTLFVGLAELTPGVNWIYRDSFVFGDAIPKHWKEYRGQTGGGRRVVAAKGKELFNTALNMSNKEDVLWWALTISGDPVRDTIRAIY